MELLAIIKEFTAVPSDNVCNIMHPVLWLTLIKFSGFWNSRFFNSILFLQALY